MKKPLAAAAIALASFGTSFAALAGPAAAEAPCPPSVCGVTETAVVRNTGIRDLLDHLWDSGMDCADRVLWSDIRPRSFEPLVTVTPRGVRVSDLPQREVYVGASCSI